MASFWDKVERRQRLAADRGAELRDLQIELWGWCDERQRDGLRTRHNGWAGSLVKRQRRNDDRVVTSQGAGADAADVVADMPVPALPAPDVRRHEVDRKEVETLAELFEYVSAAWDPGGSSYCATRTWFGCGLDDAFQRLASKEGLSAIERSALSARMRSAMPLCRNCRCNERGHGARKNGARTARNRAQTPSKLPDKHRHLRQNSNENNGPSMPAALPVDMQGNPESAQAVDV
jgi:hypothetical protein